MFNLNIQPKVNSTICKLRVAGERPAEIPVVNRSLIDPAGIIMAINLPIKAPSNAPTTITTKNQIKFFDIIPPILPALWRGLTRS